VTCDDQCLIAFPGCRRWTESKPLGSRSHVERHQIRPYNKSKKRDENQREWEWEYKQKVLESLRREMVEIHLAIEGVLAV